MQRDSQAPPDLRLKSLSAEVEYSTCWWLLNRDQTLKCLCSPRRILDMFIAAVVESGITSVKLKMAGLGRPRHWQSAIHGCALHRSLYCGSLVRCQVQVQIGACAVQSVVPVLAAVSRRRRSTGSASCRFLLVTCQLSPLHSQHRPSYLFRPRRVFSATCIQSVLTWPFAILAVSIKPVSSPSISTPLGRPTRASLKRTTPATRYRPTLAHVNAPAWAPGS